VEYPTDVDLLASANFHSTSLETWAPTEQASVVDPVPVSLSKGLPDSPEYIPRFIPPTGWDTVVLNRGSVQYGDRRLDGRDQMEGNPIGRGNTTPGFPMILSYALDSLCLVFLFPLLS
jgi:hypothetical protein